MRAVSAELASQPVRMPASKRSKNAICRMYLPTIVISEIPSAETDLLPSEEEARPVSVARRVWIEDRLSDSEKRIKEELAESLVNPDAANELRGYLDDSFRRFLTTLSLVPAGEGRALELGANPYFFTMLMRRSRGYQVELANFFGSRGESV